jgi:large subunit ribosomal protein L9
VKVVLCEHVDHLGQRGQVVNVAAGYARNFLLPKRLALLATPGNLRTLEHRRRVWAVREAREGDEARALAARLGDIGLTVTRKAGEGGTLYGSVTTSEIAALLAERGVTVDRRRIVLEAPIKALGSHEVSIRLHREVRGVIKLEVVAEGA